MPRVEGVTSENRDKDAETTECYVKEFLDRDVQITGCLLPWRIGIKMHR